jgi:hypothetical protein
MPRLPLGIRASAYIYPVISGGTLTSDATYYYRTFTANGTLAVENHSVPIDYFVIAGGGGGGVSAFVQVDFYDYISYPSGGGAAGTKSFSSATLNPASYSVVIGAGGGTGSSSSISSVASVTGGGVGGNAFGGANGGSNAEFSGGGGGGGAGAGAGGNASGITGGASFSAFGASYGSGGSGASQFYSTSGAPVQIAGSSGAVNSGSGGGASTGGASSGGGGSGRVIVRYLRSAVGG